MSEGPRGRRRGGGRRALGATRKKSLVVPVLRERRDECEGTVSREEESREKKPISGGSFHSRQSEKMGPGAGKDDFRSGEATRPGTGEAQITGNRVVSWKQNAAGGGKSRTWQEGNEGEETWFSASREALRQCSTASRGP